MKLFLKYFVKPLFLNKIMIIYLYQLFSKQIKVYYTQINSNGMTNFLPKEKKKNLKTNFIFFGNSKENNKNNEADLTKA